MGSYINTGNYNFQSARNSEYVDKSGLISVVNATLNTEQRFSCVTRSRRFGNPMAATCVTIINTTSRPLCQKGMIT